MNQLTQTPSERLFKNFEPIVREYLKDIPGPVEWHPDRVKFIQGDYECEVIFKAKKK